MSQSNGTDTLSFIYDTDGQAIGVNRNGYYYYYLRNVQGDVIALYNCYGDINSRYTYDSWGNLIAVTDANGNAITDPTHIANINPIRYRGYYYDVETGLYYLQSRYYNPQWGRFLNADDMGVLDASAEDLLATNLFAYCGNNPVNHKDPSGYFSFYAVLGAGIAGGIWNLGKYIAHNFHHFSAKKAFKTFLSGFLTGAILGALIQLPKAIVAGLIGAIVEVGMYVGEHISSRTKPKASKLLQKAAIGFSMGIAANSVRLLAKRMGWNYTKIKGGALGAFSMAIVRGATKGYLTRFFSLR